MILFNVGDEHGADRPVDDAIASEDGGLSGGYTGRSGVKGACRHIGVGILNCMQSCKSYTK